VEGKETNNPQQPSHKDWLLQPPSMLLLLSLPPTMLLLPLLLLLSYLPLQPPQLVSQPPSMLELSAFVWSEGGVFCKTSKRRHQRITCYRIPMLINSHDEMSRHNFQPSMCQNFLHHKLRNTLGSQLFYSNRT
jgi:hypothetical protein